MRLGVKIAAAFVVGLLIVGAVGIQSYLGIQRVTETTQWVAHSHEVLEDLEHVLSLLKDAETGQRGFILTGEDRYLEPYNAAVAEVPKDIDLVTSLTKDNPQQQVSLQQLQALTRDKLDELQETIKLRRDAGLDAALPIVRTDRGQRIMDDIRVLVTQMETRERDLLDARNRSASDVARGSMRMLGLGVFLSLAVLGIAAIIVVRTMRLAAPSVQAGARGRRWPMIAARYAFAVAIVGVAIAVRSWMERSFGPMPPFIIFYPGVLLVASIAGGGPGVVTTLLSALAADYWYFPPYGQFSIASSNEALALGIFAGSSLFLSVVVERMHRARYSETVSLTQERELALLNMGNVMALDLEHRIVRWSEGNHRLYGYDAQEARGKFTYEFLQTHFAQPLEQIHAELTDKGYWEGEVTRRTKDGTSLSVALLWALRRDEQGEPLAILEVSTDITRQKVAEDSLRQQAEELAQQNEELSQQSEEMAHQSEELSAQNEELQAQSEEIQALNTDLGRREKTLQALLDSARLPMGEQEVMSKVCLAALEMMGTCAVGAAVCEQQGEELHILAHAGFDGGEVPASWAAKGSFVEMVIQQDRTASLEDASLRPDLNLLAVADLPRFAAALSSPLHVKGKCIGAVSIYSDTPREWSEEQFRLIEWLAAQCSNTLEAMRLAAEIRHGQEQNEFLANIVESSSQAFGVGYPDGRLGLINHAFEQLTGYSGDELRAIDWANTLTPPEWREVERRKLEELHCTGSPARYEKEYIRKDGRRVPVELLVNLVKDAEGKPLYYYSFIADITERKHAEEALQKAKSQLELRVQERTAELTDVLEALHETGAYTRSLIEASLDPLVTIGPDGSITDVNAATEQATGLARRELIGTDFSTYFTEPLQARTGYQRVFKEGSVRDYPLEIRHSDGHTIPVLYNAVVYRDEAGQVVGVFAAARDITDRKRAEEATQRLASIVESSNDAVYAKDLDGTILTWNQAAERVYGYVAQEVIGKSVSLLAPPDHANEIADMLEKVTSGERIASFETERVRKDGRRIHVALSLSPIKDASGRIVGAASVARDVTERKELERELQAAGRYARSLIEASLDSLVTISPGGKITDVNAATEQATGLARRELIGTDFSTYFTEPLQARTGYQRVFKEGSVRDYPLEIRHRDGHTIPVLYNAVVYRDEAGQVVGVFAAARDITELKRAEEALRDANDLLEQRVAERTEALQESEDRFRTMADSMPQLAWIAKPDGFIYWYNRQWYEYTGTTPEQMEGWGWQSVHDPDALPSVMERWKASIATGSPFEMEFPLRGADGVFRRFLTRGTPLKDAQGRVVQWLGTNTDISQRAAAEEALRRTAAELTRSNKELEQFAYISAHDLQEPLRQVRSFVQMLRDRHADKLDGKAAQYFEFVHDGAGA